MKNNTINETKGILYLVPTPIGNLKDITLRAIDVLNDVDLIACEDTRHTKNLLNKYNIKTKQISFHEHNKKTRIPELIEKINRGDNIAQVSDAGTPSISDPGNELVQEAIKDGITIIPIPGATASITALIASGLVTKQFTFYGFLSRKENDKLKELEKLKEHIFTLIIYEAPHRLLKTLTKIKNVFGSNRKIVVAREVTKKYEEFIRGTIEEVLDFFNSHVIKGEIVLIIEGNSDQKEENTINADISNIDAINEYIGKGMKTTEAIKKIAKLRNVNRQKLYLEYEKSK